jgi:hypothetical protein
LKSSGGSGTVYVRRKERKKERKKEKKERKKKRKRERNVIYFPNTALTYI